MKRQAEKEVVKRIGFIVFFLFFAGSAFGQQYLWSTVREDRLAERYIPLNKVTKEVLIFFDHYRQYRDLSGYSKDGFIESFKDSEVIEILGKDIKAIEDLEVHALKTNSGAGSIVRVVCISKKNVNIVVFGDNLIYPFKWNSDRVEFSALFKTLLK